jgi:hypothetical protein
LKILLLSLWMNTANVDLRLRVRESGAISVAVYAIAIRHKLLTFRAAGAKFSVN